MNVSIFINLFIIFTVLGSFFIFNNFNSNYFRLGWSPDFIFVSINIDTGLKYLFLCTMIMVINFSDVLINEIADPILYFNTYNPDKKIIYEFTKSELLLYSNTVFFIHTLKKFLQILITVSQIDIAIISIVSTQISGVLAIRMLLNEKEFTTKNPPQVKMRYHSTGETIPFYHYTHVNL